MQFRFAFNTQLKIALLIYSRVTEEDVFTSIMNVRQGRNQDKEEISISDSLVSRCFFLSKFEDLRFESSSKTPSSFGTFY